MKFFTLIHRSIFDSELYVQARSLKLRHALLYLLALCLMVGIVSAIAHTRASLREDNPALAGVSRMFEGVTISQGLLESVDTVPRIVFGRGSIAAMAGLDPKEGGALLNQVPESLLVLDPAGDTALGTSEQGNYIMVRNGLLVSAGQTGRIALSYESVLGSQTYDFGAQALVSLMKRNWGALLMLFGIRDLFWTLFELVFSVLFLTIAACILKRTLGLGLKTCVLIACYSATPVALGAGLQSLAGTSFELARYAFMVASFVILARGVRALVLAERKKNDSTAKL